MGESRCRSAPARVLAYASFAGAVAIVLAVAWVFYARAQVRGYLRMDLDGTLGRVPVVAVDDDGLVHVSGRWEWTLRVDPGTDAVTVASNPILGRAPTFRSEELRESVERAVRRASDPPGDAP